MRFLVFIAILAFQAHAIEKLPECRKWDATGESCLWWLSAPRCTDKAKCAKLVVFFSGGNMPCAKAEGGTRGIAGPLARYAEAGYAAVCAGLYESAAAAGRVPFRAEAPRVKAIFDSVLKSDKVRAAWTGQDLLIAGVSHGATAPALALSEPGAGNWKGSRLTAACFHDGTYDPPFLDKFLLEHKLSCRTLRNRIICGRYGLGEDCPFPATRTREMIGDRAQETAPDRYSVRDWKLIECGSLLLRPKCGLLGDWLPKEPIDAFCDHLNRGGAHKCVLDPMPREGHLKCSLTEEGVDKCRKWFEGLPR